MTLAVAILSLALAIAVIAAAVLAHRARQARHRLRDAEERAAVAVHARDTFFDLATHELRSPLAAILGYQELLEDGAYGSLDPAAVDPITRIGRSARHLLHLIDGVVELARLRSGGVTPDLEPVNTGVLMSGVADAFRGHALDRGIEPRIDLPDALPTLLSDPDRLLRALDLFLASALKHPAGTTLHLDVRSTSRTLAVRIHPLEISFRDHADDPVLRLGIRLTVASRVAELLGGGVDLETEGDDPVIRGARFHVRDLAAPGPPPAL